MLANLFQLIKTTF